jgi:hypothetical protein
MGESISANIYNDDLTCHCFQLTKKTPTHACKESKLWAIKPNDFCTTSWQPFNKLGSIIEHQANIKNEISNFLFCTWT